MAVKPISIQREYEKNPDIKPEEIKKLRDWLSTQPHLPGDLLSDVDILIAYHCCENYIETTKQVIDLHYTLRTLFEQFFKNRTFDKKLEIVLNTVFYFPMVTPTVDGHFLMYLRLLDVDPKNFKFNECITLFMIIFDLCQYEQGTWPGFEIIIDLAGATLSHLAKVELMSLKKVLYFVQECMLIKLKGVHFINAPSFIDKLMMMMRPFLKKSLLDIMNIYPVGTDDIHKIVSKKAFPKDYGGEYKDVKTINSEMLQLLKANEDFFEFENKRRVNENLRPGKPTTVGNLFGIQGSFKKLEID